MKSFAVVISVMVLLFMAFDVSICHAEDQQWQNTDAQLAVMYNSDDSIGPSPSYWSQREMPMYIQNGCTEDVIHGKQECPF